MSITASDRRHVRVLSVSSPVCWIGAEASQDALAIEAAVNIHIILAEAPGRGVADVEIVTDHPIQPTLRIPVCVFRDARMDRSLD